jgi:hypothetical protein
MERSESAGLSPDIGGEQSSFQNSGIGKSSDTTSTSETVFSEPSSGGITGRVKSVASTVKDKAADIPSIIADGLEAGAKALRHNRPATETSSTSSVALTNDSTITAVTDTLASGMQSSADWLREADFDKVKDGVEKQVKEHPARSLLIALGAGYLIGKAFRR